MRTLLKALLSTGVFLWFVGTSFGTESPGFSVQLAYPHSGSYQIGTYKLINWNYSVHSQNLPESVGFKYFSPEGRTLRWNDHYQPNGFPMYQGVKYDSKLGNRSGSTVKE